MKLIFEESVPGRHCDLLPPCDVPEALPSRQRKTVPFRLTSTTWRTTSGG